MAYLAGGWHVVRHAWQALQQRHFDTDLLMLVAALGAAVLGEFAEGALLLFLFSLGHALEERLLERTRGAIRALSGLAPRYALVQRGDGEVRSAGRKGIHRRYRVCPARCSLSGGWRCSFRDIFRRPVSGDGRIDTGRASRRRPYIRRYGKWGGRFGGESDPPGQRQHLAACDPHGRGRSGAALASSADRRALHALVRPWHPDRRPAGDPGPSSFRGTVPGFIPAGDDPAGSSFALCTGAGNAGGGPGRDQPGGPQRGADQRRRLPGDIGTREGSRLRQDRHAHHRPTCGDRCNQLLPWRRYDQSRESAPPCGSGRAPLSSSVSACYCPGS